MKIALGCDHGGFNQKEVVKAYLISNGYEVLDKGTYSLDSCDYPLFARDAALAVSKKEADFGVIICTSGEGVTMAANKIKGIRAGIGYNDEVAKLMRQHNDANIITFGAKFMADGDVLRRISIFLTTEFEGGRHERRVNEIIDLEK